MSRVPRIRFKGFEEDWEQRKLGEIADKVVEKNFQLQERDVFTNSAEFGIIDQKDFFDHEIVNKNNIGGYYIVSPNDFVYNPRISVTAPVGPINRNKLCKRGIMSPLYTVFHPRNMNETFLEFFFKTNKWHKFMEYNGDSGARSDRFSIKTELFYAMTIPFPSHEEQSKVGICLESLDHLITLHQRKLEKLKIIKKSMLENLFPQNGEKTPKIRFSGFTKDWEQRKLGECFTERIESMPNGELISVTINDGIKKFSELGRHDNSNEDKSKYKKVCIGDIAYNSMRMWQGASGYSPYNGIVSPAYTVLLANEGVNSKCIAYQFKLPGMIHAFQINSQGITSDNWNLKFQALSDITIYISRSIDEQGNIAVLLESLDHLITLHQSKLDKLQKIKKSMLESMFV